MHWTETLAWIALALVLEKILDYAVWPRWVKRRAKRVKKATRLWIIAHPPKNPHT